MNKTSEMLLAADKEIHDAYVSVLGGGGLALGLSFGAAVAFTIGGMYFSALGSCAVFMLFTCGCRRIVRELKGKLEAQAVA